MIKKLLTYSAYFLVFTSLSLPLTCHADLTGIYIADSVPDGVGQIVKANNDGTQISVLPISSAVPSQIIVDSKSKEIYWTDPVTGFIKMSDIDGSNVVNLIGIVEPYGIAINGPNGKIYWSEGVSVRQINRANLDGSNVESVISTNEFSEGVDLAIDSLSGHIYYVEPSNDVIKRANLDGSNETTIINVSSIDVITGITLDLKNSKIYWGDRTSQTIYSANLDGTNQQLVTSNIASNPEGLIIDESAGPTLYWCDPTAREIHRFNTATSVHDILITSSAGLFGPTDLSLFFDDTVKPPEQTVPTVPTVVVTPGQKQATFTFETFDLDFFFPDDSASIELVSKTPSVRYDATARRSDGVTKRVITKNTQATVKLSKGTWTVSYRGLAVTKRKKTKQKTAIQKLNSRVASIKEAYNKATKPAKKIQLQNMLQTAKAKRRLARTKSAVKTMRSDSSDSFEVS